MTPKTFKGYELQTLQSKRGGGKRGQIGSLTPLMPSSTDVWHCEDGQSGHSTPNLSLADWSSDSSQSFESTLGSDSVPCSPCSHFPDPPLPEHAIDAEDDQLAQTMQPLAFSSTHDALQLVTKAAWQQIAPGDVRDLAVKDKQSSCMVQTAVIMVACQLCQTPHGHDAMRVYLYNVLNVLLADFHGCVLESVKDPWANYVICRIIEYVPFALCAFVPSAMVGTVVELANHKFGCRAMIRIIRHVLRCNDNAASVMADIVAHNAANLCQKKYSNYVLQELLEHGTVVHKQQVVHGLRKVGLIRTAENRWGSLVLEAALRHSSPEDCKGLASELLDGTNGLLAAKTSNIFACKVLKKAFRYD